MRSYDEMAENILKKYNSHVEKKRKMIRRTLAAGIGAAAVVGIGVCAKALTPPERPAAEQSGIIAETTASETVSSAVITAVTTRTEQVTATAKASANTTSVTTVNTTSVSTKNVTTTAFVTTSEAVENSEEVRTEAAEPTTEASTAPETTAAAVTSTLKTTVTTVKTAPQTTTATPQTTKSRPPYSAIGEDAFTPAFSSFEWNGNYYTMTVYYEEKSNIGEYLDSYQLKRLTYPDFAVITADISIYEISGFDSEYRLAVQYKGSNQFYVFQNFDYNK